VTDTISRWQERAERAKQNRAAMPECTAFIDAMRAQFGAMEVHVRYACENGIEWGKRGDPGVMATQPDPVARTNSKAEAKSFARYKRTLEKVGDEVATVAIVGSLFAEAAA
jgi:hypothetical protein